MARHDEMYDIKEHEILVCKKKQLHGRYHARAVRVGRR